MRAPRPSGTSPAARLVAAAALACSALVPVATAAGAAVLPGGTLVDGQQVTATVTAANQDLLYTFEATAGRHLTVDVAAASWRLGAGPGSAHLTVLDPQGRASGADLLLLGGPAFVDLTPTVTGTWSVLVDPVGAAVGSATFTLAADLGPVPLTSMTAATAMLPFRGQRAVFSFAAKAGRHVTVDVPATRWRAGTSVGTAQLTVLDPAGRPAAPSLLLGSTRTFVDLTPTRGGTWSVVVDPDAAATGSARLVHATDVATRALAVGDTVTTTITRWGRNAGYTFRATPGVPVTLDVTASAWSFGAGPGTARLSVDDDLGRPTGISAVLGSRPASLTVTPTRGGTWTVHLDPDGSATGSVTLTLR